MAVRVLIVVENYSSQRMADPSSDSTVAADAFLISQAELLANQLTLQGYHAEITTQLSHSRVLMHRYDLIHTLTEAPSRLRLRTWAALSLAKARGAALVCSDFSSTWQPLALAKVFDAITVSKVSMLQNLKLFTGEKMVFAGLCQNHRGKMNSSDKLQIQESRMPFSAGFIFPILESLAEIPDSIHLQSCGLIVDATRVSAQNMRAIKQRWHTWKNSNLLHESAFLVTHANTLSALSRQTVTALVTSHLDLDATLLHDMIQFARVHN